MSRFPQDPKKKGSQRWIQHFVNHAPELLERQIGLGTIEWLSPMAADDYAEYRDQAALDRLGINLPHEREHAF